MEEYRDLTLESKIIFEIAAQNDGPVSEEKLKMTCEGIAAILTKDHTMGHLIASDLFFTYHGNEITLMADLGTALVDDEGVDDAINFFDSCFDLLKEPLAKIGCAIKMTNYWDNPNQRQWPSDLTVGSDGITM